MLISINLQPNDYRYANRFSTTNCALAIAAKRQLNAVNVADYTHYIEIDNTLYYHDEYGPTAEYIDSILAKILFYSRAPTIRKIKLYANIFDMPNYKISFYATTTNYQIL